MTLRYPLPSVIVQPLFEASTKIFARYIQKAQEAQMDAQVDMQKAQMRQSLEERRLAQQKEIAAAKIQADLLKSRN